MLENFPDKDMFFYPVWLMYALSLILKSADPVCFKLQVAEQVGG